MKIRHLESENTASIVWEYLQSVTRLPLFWNAFPFHPHPAGNERKNRAPSVAEVNEGSEYLKELADIFQPSTIAGLGHKGTACVKKVFNEDVLYIRHPSYGGKRDFLKGMSEVLSEKTEGISVS